MKLYIYFCLLIVAKFASAQPISLKGQYTYQDGRGAGQTIVFGANGELTLSDADDAEEKATIRFLETRLFGDQAEDVYAIELEDPSVICQYVIRNSEGGAVLELKWIRGTEGCPASGTLYQTDYFNQDVPDYFPGRRPLFYADDSFGITWIQ